MQCPELQVMVQEQDKERAVRSLDPTGLSTSAQMLLNLKSDLGGEEGGVLLAQCLLTPETGQASLKKVRLEIQAAGISTVAHNSVAHCAC